MKTTTPLLIITLLVACSDDPQPKADAALDIALDDRGTTEASVDLTSADVRPDSGLLDPTGYCELMVDAYCPFYLRCGRMAESSLEACRATFLEVCNAVYEPRYAHLAAQGLLELSAEGTAACSAHLQATPCEHHLLDLVGPCMTMWRGKVSTGHACGFEIDGLICGGSSTCALDLSLCGECIEASGEGGTCGGGVGCLDPFNCISGVCTAPVLPGAACGSNVARCIPGASCASGTCVAVTYVGVGEACDPRNRCPHRSRCIEGSCIRMALLGETCGQAIPCASGYCDGASLTCKALGLPEATCSVDGQCLSRRCEGDACSSLDSHCFAP